MFIISWFVRVAVTPYPSIATHLFFKTNFFLSLFEMVILQFWARQSINMMAAALPFRDFGNYELALSLRFLCLFLNSSLVKLAVGMAGIIGIILLLIYCGRLYSFRVRWAKGADCGTIKL